MLTILAVVAGLSFLILGHEAGHFFAAKIFGLKVEEFGFGLPPRIFGLRRYRGKLIKKWHLFWRKREDRRRPAGLEPADTVYSLNFLPFGGFVRIAGENDLPNGNAGNLESLPAEDKKRVFFFQSAWKRSVIVLAGILINFLLGWMALSAVLMAGSPGNLIIEGVQKNSPGESSGFAAGDIIKNYQSAEKFIGFVDNRRGREIEVPIIRDDKEMVLRVTPRIKTEAGEGAIGIALRETGMPQHGFFAAVGEGFMQTVAIGKMTVVAFYRLLANLLTRGSLLEGVMGPVGILGAAVSVGRLGFVYVAQLLALISVNLAVINLIPFPALDGGRFLFILIEKIKGSRISAATEMAVNGIGFLLLILLMAAITVRDVAQLL